MHTQCRSARLWIPMLAAILVPACVTVVPPATSAPQQEIPPSPTPILLAPGVTFTPFSPLVTLTSPPPLPHPASDTPTSISN